MLDILWTFAMFFLELLDFQNVVLTTVCHDKSRIQILGSKSPNSGEVVNLQKRKLIIGKSEVHQACILCLLVWFSRSSSTLFGIIM